MGQHALPVVSTDGSNAVGFHEPPGANAGEVAPVVRSFRHLLFALLGVCVIGAYLSLRQIDYNLAGKALYDLDRVITALRINVGDIAASPPLAYRDLRRFSAPAPSGTDAVDGSRLVATGTSVKDVPDQDPNNRIDGAAPVPGTHLLGQFAIRFAPQTTCLVAAFSGDPGKSFRITWRGGGAEAARVSGDAISLIKFEQSCPDEMLAPSLLVIADGPNYVLGIPRSYNLVLSPSAAGLASDLADLSNLRPEPFSPGPGLLANYSQAARDHIGDPEQYDLYDFQMAKSYLAAWAARITGKWYSSFDYQFAVNDLIGAGAAQERMFGSDHRYAWFMRAALAAILALTLAMWRRIRLISLLGVPRPLPWLLADVGDRTGLVIAWLYILAVPVAVAAACLLYAEASLGIVSALHGIWAHPIPFGLLIVRLGNLLTTHLHSAWGIWAGVVLLLELFVLVACVSGMIQVVTQARRLRSHG